MKIILNDTLKQKGKSQYWLANHTGIAVSTLNNLCNNKTSGVQFAVLDKICTALDCDVNDVLCHEPYTLTQNSALKYDNHLEASSCDANLKMHERHSHTSG